MSEKDSQKEIQILDAVAEIISAGNTSVQTLKIADIADRAGIGKGTVYEYFSSKEEILCKAVFRHISMELEREWRESCNQSGFKKSLYHAMRYVTKECGSPSIWNLQSLGLLEGKSLAAVTAEIINLFQTKMQTIGEDLLRQGVAEGLFPPPKSKKYVSHAFTQLFCGLNFMVRMGERNNYEVYMDQAYTMFLAALNAEAAAIED